MTTINSISPAVTARMGFGCDCQKQETNPNRAALSAFIPGSGELLNGDTSRGLKHLGVSVGLGLTFLGAVGLGAKELLTKETPKLGKVIALGVLAGAVSLAEAGNKISSAFTAYGGKEKAE